MTDAAYTRWAKTEWFKDGYELRNENFVYLTADSDQELSELSTDETYIIGGLCDHNRYKVCFTL
jgi:tRNA (guanine9-N1)-methyltransferase